MRIDNNGPLIVDTDYWGTEHGLAGAMYLSLNARVFRLLVPPRVVGDVVPQFQGAQGAAVSRGPWPDRGLRDALEVLIDDGSDSPWAAHLSLASVDRLPVQSDVGRGDLRLSVWARDEDGRPKSVLDLPCCYRLAERLPDLRSWRRW